LGSEENIAQQPKNNNKCNLLDARSLFCSATSAVCLVPKISLDQNRIDQTELSLPLVLICSNQIYNKSFTIPNNITMTTHLEVDEAGFDKAMAREAAAHSTSSK
jgi:hypothetical protein